MSSWKIVLLLSLLAGFCGWWTCQDVREEPQHEGRRLGLADDALRAANSLLNTYTNATNSSTRLTPASAPSRVPPSAVSAPVTVATALELARAVNTSGIVILITQPLSIRTPLLIEAQDVSISGNCSLPCVLSAQGQGRHFIVNNGSSLTLRNLELADGADSTQAGAVLVKSGASLSSQGVTYRNNSAYQWGADSDGGGAVLVLDGGKFSSADDAFIGNTAWGYGGAVLAIGRGAMVGSSGGQFVNNTARLGQDSAGGGAVRLANGASFASLNDYYEGNVGSNGGAIRCDEAAVAITGARFVSNHAVNGGGITCNRLGNLNSTRNVFRGNTGFGQQSNNGPAINIVSGCNLYSTEDSFTENSGANLGGALSVDGSNATFTRTNFTSNVCKLGGGAMWVLNGGSVQSVDCWYLNNTATLFGGAVRIQDHGRFISRNDVFLNNSAQTGGAFDIDGGAVVSAESMTCSHNSAQSYGGCVHASAGNSTFSSANGTFTSNAGGKDGNGGATFYTNGALGFSVQDRFEQNSAGKTGGAVLIENKAVVVSNGSYYIENKTLRGAGVALQSQGVFRSLNDQFLYNDASGTKASLSDTNDGGAISLLSGSTAFVQGGNFRGNLADDSAGAVFVVDWPTMFESSGNTYSFNNATRGGAIFVDIKANFTSLGDTFANNTATKGGGLFLDGNGTITSSDRPCLLEHNWADGSGGGLYCSCNGLAGKAEPQSCCSISNCLLTDNQAVKGGGGAIYAAYSPDISCKDSNNATECMLSWTSNSAEYGNASATGPNHLKAEPSVIPESLRIKSGEMLPDITVSMLDDFNQVVVAQGPSTSPNLLEPAPITQVMSIRPEIDRYDIRGAQNTIIDRGSAVFKELRLLAEPGTYEIQFFSPTTPTAGNASLVVTLIGCSPGELFSNSGCNNCTAPQYSWNPANKSCDSCPTPGAHCEGGAIVLPDPGYWHSAQYSAEFHACPKPEWCDYSDRNEVLRSSLNTATWQADMQCTEGRGGKKCAECAVGFGASGTKCVKCQNRFATGVAFGGFLLLNAVVVVVLIVVTARCKDPASRQMPSLVALIKNLVSYFQVTGISYLMQLRWPAYVQWLLSLVSDVSTTGGNTVPMSCMFSADVSLRPSFQKLLLFALLPIGALALPFALWPLWQAYKRRKRAKERAEPLVLSQQTLIYNQLTKSSPFVDVSLGDVPEKATLEAQEGPAYLRKRCIMSMLVVLFFFYPTVSYQFLLIFKCDSVDSGDPNTPYVANQKAVGTFWVPDMAVECFKGTHLVFASLLGILGLGFFCLGVPLLSSLLMFHCKRDLDEQIVWEQYGFLYESYRDECYYWECISMLQKLAFVAVTVFFQGTMTQLLAALVIAEVCLVWQWYAKPFRWRQLNRIQESAWYCTIGVLVLGLWYAARPTGAAYIIISSLVVTVNIVFTVAWAWQVRALWRSHLKEHAKKLLSRAKSRVRKWGGSSGGSHERSFDREIIMAEYASRSERYPNELVPDSEFDNGTPRSFGLGSPASTSSHWNPVEGYVSDRPRRFDDLS